MECVVVYCLLLLSAECLSSYLLPSPPPLLPLSSPSPLSSLLPLLSPPSFPLSSLLPLLLPFLPLLSPSHSHLRWLPRARTVLISSQLLSRMWSPKILRYVWTNIRPKDRDMYTTCISPVYLQYTSSIPPVYLQYISSIPPVYLQYISSISPVYLQYTTWLPIFT